MLLVLGNNKVLVYSSFTINVVKFFLQRIDFPLLSHHPQIVGGKWKISINTKSYPSSHAWVECTRSMFEITRFSVLYRVLNVLQSNSFYDVICRLWPPALCLDDWWNLKETTCCNKTYPQCRRRFPLPATAEEYAMLQNFMQQCKEVSFAFNIYQTLVFFFFNCFTVSPSYVNWFNSQRQHY